MTLSLSDRFKIFTSDWLRIEVSQNAVFSKTTNRSNIETSKPKIAHGTSKLKGCMSDIIIREFTQQDGRKKSLSMTSVTGLLLACFVVIFT